MRITHLRIYHISCHMILRYMYVCTYVCMSDDIIRSICVLRISNLNFHFLLLVRNNDMSNTENRGLHRVQSKYAIIIFIHCEIPYMV